MASQTIFDSDRDMNPPLVSVIIPVHNGERFLADTIQSVLDQTYPSFELIVVDDGSTDSSAEIVQSVPGIRYFYQENQGVAAARNRGVAAARGNLLAFLDQDDLWTPDKLHEQVTYLQEHPAVGYVLTMVQFFLEPGIEKPEWIRDELLERPRPGYNLGNLLVRREVFEQVGRFDTRYIMTSDHDWFVRANDYGVTMERLPVVALLRRVHDRNESRHTLSAREMLSIHRASVQRRKSHKQ